jgi:YD repeat-containing protein
LFFTALLYNYGYDQLNRIDSMDVWAASGSFAATGTGPMQDYSERFGYDPNGNILTLNRHGTTGNGSPISMDSLRYSYLYARTAGGVGEYVPGQTLPSGIDHLTNQLSSIQDAVSGSNYTTDIDNQSAFNYQYDVIGNLTGDVQSGITGVTWSVYGKILSITNASGTINYTYDASGNRISKTAGGITTWYVRDASGNVMSVYTAGDGTRNSGALTQSEAHVYGSSRLGILNLGVNCTSLTQPVERSLVRGNKLFELPNHLGNVLVTISDKKLQHTTDGSTVDYYTADATGANDYYAFGSPMPGRTMNTAGYRYGFKGKEKDDEVKGVGD